MSNTFTKLRVSVRRAVEALRIFSGLIAAEEVDPLRNRLRQIRLAADEARNWDVMAGRLSHGGDVPAAILNQIKSRRREAQRPIVAVYQELIAAGGEAKFASLIRKVESHRHGEGKRRFGRQAPKYLVPVVKKFFKAAESDLTADASLHGTAYPCQEAAVHDGDRGRGLRFRLPQAALSPSDALPRPVGNGQRSRHGQGVVRGLVVETEDEERRHSWRGFCWQKSGPRKTYGGIPGHLDAEGRVRLSNDNFGPAAADSYAVFSVTSHISDGNLILASLLSASLDAGDCRLRLHGRTEMEAALSPQRGRGEDCTKSPRQQPVHGDSFCVLRLRRGRLVVVRAAAEFSS